MISCQPSVVPPAPVAVPDTFTAVPAFSFTERGGRTVTDKDLRGKVWVASFVFTRCTGSCPQVAATLAKLQADVKDAPDVMLVTFTIDPERDTLVDLKAYAERYRADPERWLFLTGPQAVVHTLASDGFKLHAMKSRSPKPGDEFDHASKVAVVDRRGVIRGYFEGMASPREGGAEEYAASQAKLRETVAALVKE